MTQQATWAAPGRVNLIGEHVDYNDGLVLPFALPLKTTAAVTVVDGADVTAGSTGMSDQVRFPVTATPGSVPGWGGYVAGVVWALGQRGFRLPGLRIDVSSDVPLGAGLSSSAALECSVAAAVNDALELGLDRGELVAVTRRAENDFIGLPNGPMDQMASMMCEQGHALLLDCRSLETSQRPFDLDGSGLSLLVVNTNARHELVGSEYADRRASCEAAASALGLDSLRDADLGQVRALTVPVVRNRAHHVVTEIQRVRDVVDLLDAGRPHDIGAFLTASHQSLRDDYEVSCDELDVTVDAALAAGALGARMTGGGFGGCAIALLRDSDVDEAVGGIEKAFGDRGFSAPDHFVAAASVGAHPVP